MHTPVTLFTKKKETAINERFAKNIKQQMLNYFSGQLIQFKLPFILQGTDFQQRVWWAMSRIPYAQTKTYGQLAKELNTSARAIGNACRQNPVPIIIPCHRVIASNGIGGFAGQTTGHRINAKQWLLKHETAVQSKINQPKLSHS